jgi:hypothetical protein
MDCDLHIDVALPALSQVCCAWSTLSAHALKTDSQRQARRLSLTWRGFTNMRTSTAMTPAKMGSTTARTSMFGTMAAKSIHTNTVEGYFSAFKRVLEAAAKVPCAKAKKVARKRERGLEV